jgi:hypothetical protein
MVGEGGGIHWQTKERQMLLAIFITLIITGALGYAQRSGQIIVSRPYNNRYNDASGARDDSFL